MLCVLHANNILSGCIIQSVDILYNLFIPVKWILSFLTTSSPRDGFGFGDCFWLISPGIAQSSMECSALSAGAEHSARGFGVGNHSLELFSGPASWQEGPEKASPTPGSWKNQRRPEDSALMSSGSSREGSSKVQEPFWLFWASLGLWEEPLFEHHDTNLCWSFLIYRCQTQQPQAAAFYICRSSIVLAMFLTGCNFWN